jgi:hypothetical protein
MKQRKPLKKQPTLKQKRAAKLTAENVRSSKPRPTGEILLEAGYSEAVSKKPKKVTESDGFLMLLDELLPDDKLTKTHARLLETRKIEHMVFPLGPKDDKEAEKVVTSTVSRRNLLTDDDIEEMLRDVNCTVKRIVHGENARHVYYWVHDANAQTKALELGYKVKGKMNKTGDFNMTFIAHSEKQREVYDI